MPAPPLTHHEILALVEPFARRGRPVDLAASDRSARRIVFKPLTHADASLQEVLQLDSLVNGSFKLTRTLRRSDGLSATLVASGSQPEALLGAFDQVPLDRHFDAGSGVAVSRHYQFESFIGTSTPAASRVVLRRGEVQLDGLHLLLAVPVTRGVSAEITLTAAAGDALQLPQDLLAVIGWDWARLIEKRDHWTSRVRLRGDSVRRTAGAERALTRAAQHLQQVLAEPPAAFHDRHRWARFGVVLRRSIPSLTALGMIGGVALLPRLMPEQDPGIFLALHYAPIALLAVAFGLQELPQFEIPPWPRRLRANGWRQPQAQGAGA